MSEEIVELRKRLQQNVPIAVHDTRRWAARAIYYDSLALCALLLSALALGLDVYAAGYGRALAAGGTAVTFAPLAKLGLELLVCMASFAWIAGRLLVASYRAVPKKV